jgi:DNA-binding NtrC family response regulator
LSQGKTLIALDDDVQALNAVNEFAASFFKVVTTRNARRALGVVRDDAATAVLIVGLEITGTTALTVLRAAQTLRPSIRRVVMAGPGNLAQLIEGLHSGVVERIIYKPLRPTELLGAITLIGQDPLRATG